MNKAFSYSPNFSPAIDVILKGECIEENMTVYVQDQVQLNGSTFRVHYEIWPKCNGKEEMNINMPKSETSDEFLVCLKREDHKVCRIETNDEIEKWSKANPEISRLEFGNRIFDYFYNELVKKHDINGYAAKVDEEFRKYKEHLDQAMNSFKEEHQKEMDKKHDEIDALRGEPDPLKILFPIS